MVVSSDIYEVIKRKILALFEEIKPLLKYKDPKSQYGESRQQLENLIERKLSELYTLIKDLESESYRASVSSRPRINREIKKFKSDYDSLERCNVSRQRSYMRQAVTSSSSSSSARTSNKRSEAPSSSQYRNSSSSSGRLSHAAINANEEDSSGDEGAPLLRKLHDDAQVSSIVTLHRSQLIASESEQIGHDIITQLDGQHDQLVTARDKANATQTQVRRSTRVIKSLGAMLASNRAFLLVVIALELVALALLIYFRFFT